MFIRRRLNKYGRESCQIIATYRRGKKVKQRIIFNLGRSANLNGARQRIISQLDHWSFIAVCKHIITPEERSQAKAKVLQLQSQLTALDKLMLTYEPSIEAPKPPKEEVPDIVFVDPIADFIDDS